MNKELEYSTMDRRLASERLVRRLTKTPEPATAPAAEQKPGKKTTPVVAPPDMKVAPA